MSSRPSDSSHGGRRSYFRSLRLQKDSCQTGPTSQQQTEVGVLPFLKVNFTLESLLDFQNKHRMHGEIGPDKEKVLEENHHKRPNYNNQQRRLLAKGRQHQEQLVSKH